jgi:PST family polysaccharide transporter
MNRKEEGIPARRLTKNVLSLTLVQIANYVFPIISVPIISRIIGPGKFGILNFAVAFVLYFVLLVAYGFDYTATRKISRDPDNAQNRSKVFSEVFYTQCLLFVVSAIIFALLLFIVPELRAHKLIFIYTFLTCLATLFTQNWLFQAMQDLSKVAIFNLVSKALYTIFVLIVVRKNEDYVWQPLLIGAIQVAISIWSFTWALNKYQIKLTRVSFSRCRQVLGEGRIIFFSLFFANLYTGTNTVILGFYQNAEQVGYYTAAQRLIVIAQSVLAIPLAQSFYPVAGRAFGEGREQGLRMIQKLVPLIVVFLGVASVGMFLFGPWVIKLFYGYKFAPAIPAFRLLAVVPLFYMLNNLFGIQIMVNLGMDKIYFRLTALAGLLSVTLNLLTIYQWGYMGTAANWLITETFLCVLGYAVLRQKGLNPINGKYFRLSVMREYVLQSLAPKK